MPRASRIFVTLMKFIRLWTSCLTLSKPTRLSSSASRDSSVSLLLASGGTASFSGAAGEASLWASVRSERSSETQRYAVVFSSLSSVEKSGNFRCRRATLYIGFCSRAQIAFLFQRRDRIADVRNIFLQAVWPFWHKPPNFQYGSDGNLASSMVKSPLQLAPATSIWFNCAKKSETEPVFCVASQATS